MSVYQTATADRKPGRVMEALANSRRRSVLSTLIDREEPTSERALASEVAADSPDDADSVHTGLHHQHLPVLDDAGLVAWDRSEATVSTTDHAVFESAEFRHLLARADDWAGALDCLADRRRRRILALLANNEGPISRTSLARVVAAREAPDDSSPSTRDVLITLHHSDLPELDDAGLVDYDVDAETVAFADHPVFDLDLDLVSL